MSRAFGQSVLVDNRPGGGTVIGTDYVAKRRPGELNYVSTSLGAGHHLAAEGIKLTAKIDMHAVHYAGTAPTGTAVMGG